MRHFLVTLTLGLLIAAAHADSNGNDNGNPFSPNGNSSGTNNGSGNNNGNGYGNNNGNGSNNGNGYGNNNGNGSNNGNGYGNNNGNGTNNGNGYGNNNGNGTNNGNGYGNNNGNSFGANNQVGNGYANVVQKFSGIDPRATTAAFTVQDKWQVFWFVPTDFNISILSAVDGSVVAGAHGRGKGALYLGKGGAYYIQLESVGQGTMPWYILVSEAGAGTRLPDASGGQTFSQNGDPTYTPPNVTLPPRGGMPFGGNFNNGGSNQNGFSPQNMGGQPPNPAPIVKLTGDQERAVVLIKGDNAEGTGFLIKTHDGPQVVTNIHVIANNPNLKVTTSTGALITVLSSKGASDRDLAMLSIKDAGYSYLEVAPDISQTVQPGDEVVTPGNSQGGEVMLNTGGKVLGIGPERIEFDNPIYHGNSGGPVFHTKSGKVLGVVTEAMKVDMSNDLDKASFSSRNSAISGTMRYFGLRLDTVSQWIPIDSRQFAVETAFLDQFHEQSRRIDAYLNSDDDRNRYNSDSGNDDSKIYLADGKIMKALDGYHERSSGADTAQRLDALRGLIFDLGSIVDLDVAQVKNANNFYSFDQERAREELDYRTALKTELDSIGNNVDRMGHLPRTNN